MKFYSAIQKVNLIASHYNKAKLFAEKVTSTTNYSDSNQNILSKISNDHLISKLGEEAAKLVLSRFATVTEPDYKIYLEKQKSWKDDLFVDGVGVAIKTQKRSSAKKYGLSWTFQSGQFRRDTILSQPDTWIVFVEYNDTNPYYEFLVYPPFQIKELQFGEPKLLHLRASKKVVYAETLPLILNASQ